MKQSKIIDVAIVEDEAKIRDSWQKKINSNGTGMSCTLTYSSMESAKRNISALRHVDVILMDINLPGMSGIEGTKILKEELENVDIIMLTVEQDDDNVFEAFKNGATGYFVKNYVTEADYLITGIREVNQKKGSVMSAKTARQVTDYFAKYGTTRKDKNGILYFKELTPSQNQTLKLLANGYGNQQIADELSLSVDSIKKYCTRIYEVLNVTNRVQAALRARGLQ